MREQPIHDEIDCVLAWLNLPPELRGDSSGALVMLGRIKARLGLLLGSVKAVVADLDAASRVREEDHSPERFSLQVLRVASKDLKVACNQALGQEPPS